MGKRTAALLTVCLLLAVMLPSNAYAQPDGTQNPFSDVSEGNRFYDSVMWAYNTGVTVGKTDTTFAPSATCTRAQVVTFLWRAAGMPQPTATENPFTDIRPGAYYYSAVLWALQEGITSGKTETTFEPDEPVLREQFVTFLWRAAGKPEVDVDSPFTDVPKSRAYYYKAVVWACKNGITSGTGNGLFGMGSNCTRAQTVMFLYRYFENKPSTAPSGILLNATELIAIRNPVQLTGTILPDNANPNTITWSSSDTSVAVVSGDGLVTPIGTGNAVITAQCGSAVAYCTVSCEMQPAIADGWSEDVEALKQEVTALKQQLTDLTAALEALQTQSGTLNANVSRLEEETDGIGAALSDLELETDALDSEVDSLHSRAAGLQTRIDSFTQNIQGLDARISELEHAVASLQAQGEITQQAIDALNSQAEVLKADIAAIQSGVSALEQNMTGILERLDYLSVITGDLLKKANALSEGSLLQNADMEQIKKMLGWVPQCSTIHEAYLSEEGCLCSIPGSSQYYVNSYPVKAGVTYRLYGKDVRLNVANASLAVFSVSNMVDPDGYSAYDSILIGNDSYDLTVATDYDITFTAACDGYILIAHVSDINSLSVEVSGRFDSKQTPVTIQIFGDSMSDNTWGDKRTWVDLLPELLPDYELTILNNAIAGNTLTDFTNLDGVSVGVARQILSENSELDPGADLIIIWAGSNDWTSIYSLGTMLDGDSTTVYGAVQNIITYISENSDAQILFITPLQRNSEGDRQYRTETDMYGNRLNNRSYTLEQFSEAIRETCAYYAIPCLDLYHTSGINQDNITGEYSADGLHVNEAGEKLLAAQITEMILHPTSSGEMTSGIPAYDLSTYTDTFKDALFETVVVDGDRAWLNKDHSGIKHAFSKGAVKLAYKVEINGETVAVQSIGTATYAKESDAWYFADTFEYGESTICVTMKFGDYGMEAKAFTVPY